MPKAGSRARSGSDESITEPGLTEDRLRSLEKANAELQAQVEQRIRDALAAEKARHIKKVRWAPKAIFSCSFRICSSLHALSTPSNPKCAAQTASDFSRDRALHRMIARVEFGK
jgi:hypothetical protein